MVSASNQMGIDILRKSTEAFIRDDWTEISLIPGRGVAVEQPGGGFDYNDAAPRTPQRFKVIASNGGGTGIQPSGDGETIRKFDYVLVGRHGCVAEIGDYWTDGANSYRITAVLAENGYERKFGVESLGEEPNYG